MSLVWGSGLITARECSGLIGYDSAGLHLLPEISHLDENRLDIHSPTGVLAAGDRSQDPEILDDDCSRLLIGNQREV